MADILAEIFDQFCSEEQAFIRATEAAAKGILAEGERDLKAMYHISGSLDLRRQDQARSDAACTEFIGYQRVLMRRVDPLSTESVQQLVRQLDRVCEGVLKKHGYWEGKDAIAELRAEAERLAWLSHSQQLASAKASGATLCPPKPGPMSRPTFPERAAWLKRAMAERASMTPYQLHKFGGPDPKTVRKILNGQSVRLDKLDLVADGLSHFGGKVSPDDIPKD
jgi:hypothetical protein